MPVATAAPAKIKKHFERAKPGRSQSLRHTFQFIFLTLNVWICAEFYLFVRFYERGGVGIRATRPPGVEGWLPIASLMNLKVLLASGQIPALHPAGMFLLLSFLAMSWIFRKSFCGWLCPIGTVSEYLWRLGRQTFGRNYRLPRKLDIGLRSLKYLLLGLFFYAVGSMSVPAIHAFLESPYGLVDDVKMLNFFRFLGVTGGVVMALLVVASVFVQNFWCRYLCPYGALMGLAALASPLRIRRDAALCIDCGKCAKACPSALPVDRLVSIASAECTACLQCVESCPAAGALIMAAPRRRRVPAWTIATGVAVLFLGFTTYARMTNNWHTNLPERLYFELVPHATEFTHPR
ncbi:MAG TPA: 4Fe-4S binding protein [Candidatus Sulfopaludibacter sp.]|jgi:polyferredoxin|nr:4Fe-4S binding protein [Candidatus Sulfopaludibacter sp.]